MKARKSSSSEVKSYILGHPSVRDCLFLGLINHSALARQICRERSLTSLEAVLAAVKRFPLPDRGGTAQNRISALIRDVQVRVSNKIAVVVIDQTKDFERLLGLQKTIRKARGRCNLIDGDEVVTLIISEQHLTLVSTALKNSIRRVTSNLAQINLIFDESIETTPGVVAHFYGLLAYHGVNVREEMSCWTDLILVVDEKDVGRALEVLRIAS